MSNLNLNYVTRVNIIRSNVIFVAVTLVYQLGTPVPHPMPPETTPTSVLPPRYSTVRGPPSSPAQGPEKIFFLG